MAEENPRPTSVSPGSRNRVRFMASEMSVPTYSVGPNGITPFGARGLDPAGDGPEPWTRRFLVISASRRMGEGARVPAALLDGDALAGATGAQAAGRRSCGQGSRRQSSGAVEPQGGTSVARPATGPTRSIRYDRALRDVDLEAGDGSGLPP